MWSVKTSWGGSPLAGVNVHETANDNTGRAVWVYDENDGTRVERRQLEEMRQKYTDTHETQHHAADQVYRLHVLRQGKTVKKTQDIDPSTADSSDPASVAASLRRGMEFFGTLQTDDGFWPSDYGGPLFLTPGLVITCYISGVEFPAEHKKELIRYIKNQQREDGGLGLHIEGHSTMFGTSLNYVTARLLGMPADDPFAVRARKWMHERGGALYNTSWAKFWLCVLGVYEWNGINPLTPEMWLLPHWLVIAPTRFWCHARMVYLSMSYIYGIRAVCPANDLTRALRMELYPSETPYDSIDWPRHRNSCGPEDLYTKHNFVQDAIWTFMFKTEPYIPTFMRKRALKWIMSAIHHEDEASRYVGLGPVNKAINMLACHFEEPGSESFKKHIPRVFDYLWLAEDGMKMSGYNGSQLWDVAFFSQAICGSGLAGEFPEIARKAHNFIERSQCREDPPQAAEFYRHITKGAWPFSTVDNGWIVADCSAEALSAVLVLERLELDGINRLDSQRLYDCVNVILSLQNNRSNSYGSGGWATYEQKRAPGLMEYFNPSECFGGIMVDYEYVELTSAVVQALCRFQKHYPEHRATVVRGAIDRGLQYMNGCQREDGSWYGSWGVCFTYGTWFGIEGLVACGAIYETSVALQRAVAFLLAVQRDDGGWGESYLSSSEKVYTQAHESQIVNTSWAMLGLLTATRGTSCKPGVDGDAQVVAKVRAACAHAATFLLRSQWQCGDWPQQLISGVFNHNCMITYANYRNIFPIWALGAYRRCVLLGEHDCHS